MARLFPGQMADLQLFCIVSLYGLFQEEKFGNGLREMLRGPGTDPSLLHGTVTKELFTWHLCLSFPSFLLFYF